jgi:uncharacterized RDD family membrane protein YckC
MRPEQDDDAGFAADADGITARLSRMAMRPARAAARSGRTALTGEAERAIDGVLAGPLPEAVARSLVEHRVVERVLAEWLEAAVAGQETPGPERERLERALEQALASPAVEQRLADALGSRLSERLAERVVHSAAFERALSEVLASPEVRTALTRQTAGFGADVAASLRRNARSADDEVEARIGRAVGRQPRDPADSAFGGLAGRGTAIVVDALLAHSAFLVAVGSVALVASLAGAFHSTWLTGALVGAGWAVVVAAYFVFFWSTTGQTPGMRLMRLRVLTGAGAPPSVWRSIVRFVGLILAIIPMFAGFLPVLFDRRRRALQDYIAGTAVVAEPDAPGPFIRNG